MRLLRPLAALLGLAGCASVIADDARTRVVGMNAIDLQSCMGAPDRIVRVGPDTRLLIYGYESSGGGVTLSLIEGAGLSLSQKGVCKAVVRVTGAIVEALHYAEAEEGMAGPYAACSPIVRDCVLHLQRTPLPRGYSSDMLDAEAALPDTKKAAAEK